MNVLEAAEQRIARIFAEFDIMKNDHCCKYMGFAMNKTETARRAAAEERYGSL